MELRPPRRLIRFKVVSGSLRGRRAVERPGRDISSRAVGPVLRMLMTDPLIWVCFLSTLALTLSLANQSLPALLALAYLAGFSLSGSP